MTKPKPLPRSSKIRPGPGPVQLSIESCGGCPYEGATELVGDDWLPTCRHDDAPPDLACVEDGYPPVLCPLRKDPRVALRTGQR